MSRGRAFSRLLLVLFYAIAGAIHVAKPHVFLRVMPFWVPHPWGVIVATGLCELAGAAGLLVPRLRRAAAVLLALYALCVFPANIKHMLDFAASGAAWTGWLYHGPRMLLQPVIIWWTLHAGAVTDWPWRRSAE